MDDLPLQPALLTLLLGGVLGGVAGWLTLPAAEPPPPLSESVPPEEDCSERLQDRITEVKRTEEELVGLAREVDRQRRRRAAVRGQVRPWPDAPPDPLSEDAIAQHLDEALDGLPATLEALDCTAYPCVAVISWDTPEEELDLIDAGDGEANLSGRLMANLMEGPYSGLPHFTTGRMLGGTDRSVHAFTWLDPADYTAAKEADPGQAMVDGTVVDGAHGRAEEVLWTWVDERGPEEAP